MNPFFFGSGKRRLFGVYTPGQSSGGGDRAAVLCSPWGQEYLRAHRSLKHLATLLSRAGIHVLRFDYYGTGDSTGQMSDGDLEGWEADIEMAIEELKDTTMADQVGLVGLRLGATLAARVAARRSDVNRLVLWDPVVSGDEYLRDLDTVLFAPNSYSAASKANGLPPGQREILGFTLTDRLAEEIRSLDLVSLMPSLPTDSHIVVSASLPSHHRVRAHRTVTEIPSSLAWLEDANTGVGAIPVKLLQEVVEWFR